MKPIATRELFEKDNKNKKYLVEVFAPVLSDDGIYRCEIRIENAPEGLSQMMIGGSDSYQSLLLALETLHTMVEVFNRDYMSSKLRWVDDSEDLGFGISTS